MLGAVLLPYSFDHHCTIIQKEHGGEAKQDVKLCNTVLAFTHSEPVLFTFHLEADGIVSKRFLNVFSPPPCIIIHRNGKELISFAFFFFHYSFYQSSINFSLGHPDLSRDFRREWFQWRPWSHDLNGCL